LYPEIKEMPPTHKKTNRILILSFFCLAACSFPALGAPTEPSIDPVLTDAARTIEARLTSEAGGSQPTATLGWAEYSPTPLLNETPVPPDTTVIPEETIPPTTESSCEDRAHFVSDVSYPDGTEVEAGIEFTKTWRLQNTGTCTWTSDYAIVFERGDSMEGSPSAPLTEDPVLPQGEVDVSVVLKSPDATGTYQGYWQLRDKGGLKFGTGENGEKDFWVKITIGEPSGIAYDFIAQASKAVWVSSGGEGQATLNFGGADGDPNGVAKLKQDIKLENNSKAGVTLITHPKHVDHGSIYGTFPEYAVQNGDHFKSKLGFLDDCGEGDVLFQLWYQVDQVQNKLAEWSDSCDGSLVIVDTDLSNIVGEKVQFVLVVSANGSPVDDLAIWGSTRIER
jgi:hypothetical protein